MAKPARKKLIVLLWVLLIALSALFAAAIVADRNMNNKGLKILLVAGALLMAGTSTYNWYRRTHEKP